MSGCNFLNQSRNLFSFGSPAWSLLRTFPESPRKLRTEKRHSEKVRIDISGELSGPGSKPFLDGRLPNSFMPFLTTCEWSIVNRQNPTRSLPFPVWRWMVHAKSGMEPNRGEEAHQVFFSYLIEVWPYLLIAISLMGLTYQFFWSTR